MPRRVQGPDGKVHEFPDGTTDAEVADALESLSGPTPPARGFGPMQLMMDDQANRESRRADAKANAPMTAAMVATALAPPTALATIPVAAGAGYLGARLRGDSRRDAAVSGAIQGALEGGGLTMGKALQAVGRRVYRGLLKPAKAVRDEFPNVSNELLNARRRISPAGVEAADAAVSESSRTADAMIDAAAPTAKPVQAMDIIPAFGEVADVTGKRVDVGVVPESEIAKITARVNRLFLTASKDGGIPLKLAQELKKTAQEAAVGAYKQMRAGNIKQLGTDDLLDAATARGIKEAIEVRVPGIKEVNAETRRRLGQLTALEDAVGRTGNHLPFGSVSDLAAMAAGGLTHPAVGVASKLSTFAPTGSTLAIAANELGKRGSAIPQALRIGQIILMGGKPMRVTDLDENGLPVLAPMMRNEQR